MKPWPGQNGTAVYCGTQAHTYRMALSAGDPGERCVNCGWIRGGGSRQKVRRK
jgi:hypothetical protein